ncbi:MAG: lactate racemase domain-containing protein [Chloroflexota bacterium]
MATLCQRLMCIERWLREINHKAENHISIFDNLNIQIAGGLDISLPAMAKVEQTFAMAPIADIETAVFSQINRPDIAATINEGANIAIGVGSRGIANLEVIVRATVEGIRKLGGHPFIFPAMGSHGGATAEGQAELLAGYGITEARVGAPIRATMETVLVSTMSDGTELYMDKFAYEADGVVLINRIKPHTDFKGAIESGIIKMMVIGMGKIQGATMMHTDHGMISFAKTLPPAASQLMAHIPFLFGVGLVEDGYENTAVIEAISANQLIEREQILQAKAKQMMARLHFPEIDVLIIEKMGKDISGAGMDPNVIGRGTRAAYGFNSPKITKIVTLDLTEKTKGNATGVGLADVITSRLFNKIDFEYTYANVITSAYLDAGAIPLVMKTDKAAICLAVKTTPRVKPENARIVLIRDTLTLDKIYVSEPLLSIVAQDERLHQIGECRPLRFDVNGRLQLTN